MRKFLLAAAAALALLSLADEHPARAAGGATGSLAKEVLTCPSPCSVAVDNKAIFAAKPQRSKWTCRNVGAADVYLCENASGNTCSSAAYDILLTTAGKDSYTEETGTIWRGPIAASSTGSTLACFGHD